MAIMTLGVESELRSRVSRIERRFMDVVISDCGSFSGPAAAAGVD